MDDNARCSTCDEIYAAHARPNEMNAGKCLLCECELFIELPEAPAIEKGND